MMRGLLCVNPANARAFRTSRISCPCSLSRSNGSRVASAAAPFAGARGCTATSQFYVVKNLLGTASPRPGCHRRSGVYLLGDGVPGDMEQGTGGCSPNQCHGTMGGPDASFSCQSIVKQRFQSWPYTLIRCAPSTLPMAPVIEMKPLLLACNIIEFGLLTDDGACEPRRSSGSHKSCSIRLTPSWDTRGREGKRRDCFQFRIFCRVTWR